MQIIKPNFVGEMQHTQNGKSEAVTLHHHDNADILAKIVAADGKLLYDGKPVVKERVSFYLDGTITEAAGCATVVPDVWTLAKDCAGCFAQCTKFPATDVVIPIKSGSTVIAQLLIKTDGTCTFSGAATTLQAGTWLSIAFDALANTGGGNVSVVLVFA